MGPSIDDCRDIRGIDTDMLDNAMKICSNAKGNAETSKDNSGCTVQRKGAATCKQYNIISVGNIEASRAYPGALIAVDVRKEKKAISTREIAQDELLAKKVTPTPAEFLHMSQSFTDNKWEIGVGIPENNITTKFPDEPGNSSNGGD